MFWEVESLGGSQVSMVRLSSFKYKRCVNLIIEGSGMSSFSSGDSFEALHSTYLSYWMYICLFLSSI